MSDWYRIYRSGAHWDWIRESQPLEEWRHFNKPGQNAMGYLTEVSTPELLVLNSPSSGRLLFVHKSLIGNANRVLR